MPTVCNNTNLNGFGGTIYFGMGYGCNNNCTFCVIDAKKLASLEKELTTGEVTEFINRLSPEKEITIELSGGEPTIRKDFLFILQHLHDTRPNIKIVLFTNGRIFSNMDFTEKMSRFPLHAILIPLQGHTREIHDLQTRAKGSFVETVEGIRNLFEYGFDVIIKTIVTRQNYRYLPEIAKFVSETFPACRKYSIDALDVSGAAIENKDSIAVSFRESSSYILNAVTCARDGGLNALTLLVPPCTVNGMALSCVAALQSSSTVFVKEVRSESLESGLNRGKIEKCAGCKYAGNCQGTWLSYFDVFGKEEITPIKADA